MINEGNCFKKEFQTIRGCVENIISACQKLLQLLEKRMNEFFILLKCFRYR